ncbi:galactose-binding domain-like protein [Schizophyllum amplum]|uniref:Galactose-binding domain-like protein n=1 Tax=Schizophyllum amplum TaxID=97359 RepID=A0A550CJA6_9AGAR|nr:galactose-binding domain-like protein [Auriculariopsis ampla]
MPHEHIHNGCAGESHEHDHGHDHDTSDLGPQDNLYSHVDRGVVHALNANGEGPEVIKPWHERLDETEYLESDADDQMIIRVPFTGAVRLRSILLKTGPTDQTPSKVVLFANAADMDFDDVADKTATQEFDVAQGREVGEYAVKTAKFSNISSITLFFPAAQGADTTRVYYVGFLGHWQERNTGIPITVYEAQANLADHEKITGTDGNFSRLGS